MRKILLTLFAIALVVAFTAPAYAANNLTLKGFYRIRGYSANNLDQDDDARRLHPGYRRADQAELLDECRWRQNQGQMGNRLVGNR